MSEQKSKSELLTVMRELQQAYAKAAAELKEFTFAEDKAEHEKRQLQRFEAYKAKYTFYIQADGTAKTIDWEEINKLLTTSFASYGSGKAEGYSLGFDQNGMEGLGFDFGNGNEFTPMVEEEGDVRKFNEREVRRKEFAARLKRQVK